MVVPEHNVLGVRSLNGRGYIDITFILLLYDLNVGNNSNKNGPDSQSL